LQVVRGQLPEDEASRTPYVSFTEKKGETTELQVTPVEVGPLVAPALLHIGKVILTSATLAPTMNFGWLAREYGLAESQHKIKESLPSPFAYEKLSALYLSPTAPLSDYGNKDAYHTKISEEIHELLAASRGGAFVLCSSKEDMHGIYDNLLRKAGGWYRMARQIGNVDNALGWFREDPTSVLIGVKSLWEGVDMPGLHLRLIIIPRLPFPNRSDVVLAARKERHIERLVQNGKTQKEADMQSWVDFDLQEALMELRQAGGRLIRTETDKGIVAILDPRATGSTKNYSAKVSACFPHPPTTNKKLVLEFLGRLAGLAITEKQT
jgi:ATP-dependent DNA helicase DinG